MTVRAASWAMTLQASDARPGIDCHSYDILTQEFEMIHCVLFKKLGGLNFEPLRHGFRELQISARRRNRIRAPATADYPG
jgi:hypothetical protein